MSDNQDNTHLTNLTLEQSWNLWQAAKRGVADAVATEHEALRTVAKAGGKTFTHGGQLYQIRERKDKKTGDFIPFICALKRPPREWLAEAREKAYADAEAAGQTTPAAPTTESTERVVTPVEPTQQAQMDDDGAPPVVEEVLNQDPAPLQEAFEATSEQLADAAVEDQNTVDTEPPPPIAATGSGSISGAALFTQDEPQPESTIVLD